MEALKQRLASKYLYTGMFGFETIDKLVLLNDQATCSPVLLSLGSPPIFSWGLIVKEDRGAQERALQWSRHTESCGEA